MSTSRLRAVLLLLSFAAPVALAGCGSTGPVGPLGVGACPVPPGGVALAVSGRANRPAPILPAEVQALVARQVAGVAAGVSGPPLSLINVDGAPTTVVSGQSFRSTAGNVGALDDDRKAFTGAVESAVAAVRAQAGEVDVLGGLALAARAARGADASPGTVVLIDSGLQTVAPLDLRASGLLDADPAEVVSFLSRTGAIPDLSGMTVVLVGLGDTAAPQPPLGVARRARTVALWSGIARAGGAACVAVLAAPVGGLPPADVPPVGVVPVPPPPSLDLSSTATLVLRDDETVGFVPGQAVFRDPASAAVVLRPLAAWLGGEPGRTLALTGTTARWGSLAGRVELAVRRAETVKAALVTAGADPALITTRGLGSDFPGYRPDNDAAGNLLPGPAALNRQVLITRTGS